MTESLLISFVIYFALNIITITASGISSFSFKNIQLIHIADFKQALTTLVLQSGATKELTACKNYNPLLKQYYQNKQIY